MNCQICGSDMKWGNVYLKGNILDFLTGYRERHLFFDAYNPNEKPIKLMNWGQKRNGVYCNSCEGVYLYNEDIGDNCINCGQKVTHGYYHIRKSVIGQFIRNTLNHFYFSSVDNQITLKVLNGDDYKRGFYCLECDTLFFIKG